MENGDRKYPIIFIIRHGEKLLWEGGDEPSSKAKAAYVDNRDLSPKGWDRAHALVAYFTTRHDIVGKYGVPCAIFAQVPDPSGGPSRRPRDTMEPLGRALGLPIIGYARKDHQAMLRRIMHEPAFHGRPVVISWSHKRILRLVHDLAVPDSEIPRHWPEHRYDITLVVSFDAASGHPSLTQLPQKLLYGDSPTVLPLPGEAHVDDSD